MKYKKVEFHLGFYGRANVYIEDENPIECGKTDINKIFGELLGKRIQDQYLDGCTIFLLGKNQIQKLRDFWK